MARTLEDSLSDANRWRTLQRRDEADLMRARQQATAAKGASYGSTAWAQDPNRYGSTASQQFPSAFGGTAMPRRGGLGQGAQDVGFDAPGQGNGMRRRRPATGMIGFGSQGEDDYGY